MDKAEITKDLAKQLLDLIGVSADIEVENGPDRLRVGISVDEAGFLIGREGENLRSLQHILMLMVSKKTGEIIYPGNFVLDVNNYQKEKESYLEAVAKNAANHTITTRKPVELDPMPAFERRIVHLTIEKIDGVKSESVGEREDRRVVIKPTDGM